MNNFVSGRSNDRFTPRVVIHDKPIPWDEYVKLTRKPTIVSHADQAAMEAEAQVKHKCAERETKQKKKRKRNGYRFSLAPTGPTVSQYETDERMTRIHREVERIRNEAAQVRAVYDTIKRPNSKQRRTLKRIMQRMEHEIDRLPSR